MTAPPSHYPAKKSAEGEAKSADAAPSPKDPRSPNSVWQSLAMRSGTLQAKLTIGQADDSFEREADRVADQVMRIPAPQSGGHALAITPVAAHQAQRKCAECEEEEEGGTLQRKENVGVEFPAVAPPIVHETVNSLGQPLDATTRAYFEPRFGHDFTRVRLHTDSRAAESARAVNALAFTIGNDIVLGAGQYRPRTTDGNSLLAHELTHVVQQAQAPQVARRVQRQTPAEATSDHASVTPGVPAINEQGLSQLDREHPEFSRQLKDFSQRFWDLYELTQGPLILSGVIDATHHIQALTEFKYYLGLLRRQEQNMNQGARYSPRDIHNWLEFVEGALGAVGPLMDLAAPGVSDDLQETEAIREIRSRLPQLGAELTELQGASFIQAESEMIEAQNQAGRDEAAAEAARRETPEGRLDAAIDFTREYVKDDHKWWPNQDHSTAEVFAEQLGYYYIHEEKLSGADIRVVLNALAAEDDLLDRALYQGLLLEYLLLEGVTDLGVAELPRATGGGFYNGFNLTWLELLQRDPITTPGLSAPTPLDVFKFELGLHWGLLVGIKDGVVNTAMDVVSLFQLKTYTEFIDLLFNKVWDEKERFELGKSFALALHAYLKDIADDGAFEIGQKLGQFVGTALVEIILGVITGGLIKVLAKLLSMTRWGAALVRFVERVVDAMPWVEPKVVDVDEDLPVPTGHPDVPSPRAMENLPELSPDEIELLKMTREGGEYKGELPKDIANKELQIVKRAKPTEIKDAGDGYIYEVDLGNGHKWKGKKDGRWCRFSDPPKTNCTDPETEVPKPEPIEQTPTRRLDELAPEPEAPEERAAPASSEGTEAQQPGTEEEIITEGQVDEAEPAEPAEINEKDLAGEEPAEGVTSNMRVQEKIKIIMKQLEEAKELKMNLMELIKRASREGKTVFPAQIGDENFADVDEVIEKYNSLVDSNEWVGEEAKRPVKHGRREMNREERIIKGEITETRNELEKLRQMPEKISGSLKERLRKKSPGDTLRGKFKTESGGEDKVFGGQAPTGISPDHIVPFSEIIEMDGFSVLDEEQMVDVLNWEENLIAMDSDKNSTRGNKRWQDWQVDAYSFFDASVSHQDRLDKIAEMIAKENDLRPKIQKMIHDRVNERLGK